MERASAGVGKMLVGLAMAKRRRELEVVVTEHRDAKGRVTPVLRLGIPRKGRLVFLHGFGDRTDTFMNTAAKLAEEYEVIVPSMPAFGDGWVDPGETYTTSAYGRWMRDVLVDQVAGPFHLMGNSLGGLTALHVALAIPERVQSLTLVCAAGVVLRDVRSVHDDALDGNNPFFVSDRADYESFVARVFARPAKLPRPVADHLYLEHLDSRVWFEKLMNDFESELQMDLEQRPFAAVPLEEVRVPTLVVWGENDGLFPVEHGRYFAEKIPGARFELLEGIGHAPHIESPKKLAQAFRDHVASLNGSH